MSFAHTLGFGCHALHNGMSLMGSGHQPGVRVKQGTMMSQVSVLLLLWHQVPVGVEDRHADKHICLLVVY